jgi:hypothetical protein
MGKEEFPEVNRDARERRTWRLGLDWCKCALAGHVKPRPYNRFNKTPRMETRPHWE